MIPYKEVKIIDFYDFDGKPNKTQFKKGFTPWNKNKKGHKLKGKKQSISVLQFDLNNNFIKENEIYLEI